MLRLILRRIFWKKGASSRLLVLFSSQTQPKICSSFFFGSRNSNNNSLLTTCLPFSNFQESSKSFCQLSETSHRKHWHQNNIHYSQKQDTWEIMNLTISSKMGRVIVGHIQRQILKLNTLLFSAFSVITY